jgi:hypothetical protein
MTDYFAEAERLLKPQPQPERINTIPSEAERASARLPKLPADPRAAQVLATLAVASQLGRIADALGRLADSQARPR